jgi:hypothetical protein
MRERVALEIALPQVPRIPITRCFTSVPHLSAHAVQGSADSHAAPSASMRSRTPSRTTCLPHAVRRSQFFSPSSSEFRAGGAGGMEHAPVQPGPATEGATDSLVDGVRLTRAVAQRRCAGRARACAPPRDGRRPARDLGRILGRWVERRTS